MLGGQIQKGTARGWTTKFTPLGPLILIFKSFLAIELRTNVAPLGPHPFVFSRESVCPSVLEAPEMFLGASGIYIYFNW